MNGHLFRSRDDRMIAGVAGGLAELWDADPSLIRIVWAVLAIVTGGVALIVYIVMAVVVPEEDGESWAGEAINWGAAQRAGGPPADGTPAAGGTASFADGSAATGSPAANPPSGAPASGWSGSRPAARAQRRAARWEARAQRRAARGSDGRTGAVIVGLILILVGAWYLLREFLPTIDFDWFWPLVLVGIGILVLVLAIRPGAGDRGGSGGGAGTAS